MNRNTPLILCLLLLPSLSKAQDLEQLEKEIQKADAGEYAVSQNRSKVISLHDAIEEGLRKNYSEKARKFEFQINELDYQNAHAAFYYPTLQLKMATTSDHFAENFYRDPVTNASSSKTPKGYIGLGFEDYTLFNWGKDYLEYLNAKETYDRQKEVFKEQRRELRLSIIAEYFNLSRLKNIVSIHKKQLSHTSFVYRLTKEKMTLRKISSQEFLQAKALFLEAHQNYHESNTAYYKVQESLANLLGDDPQTLYNPVDRLKFNPITLEVDDTLNMVKQNNPDILDAESNVRNSRRSYEKTLKENLPLPKFSLKLGSYKRIFSDEGYEDTYQTMDNSKNIELAATVNMTWTIFGSGGLFNSRTKESSYYQKRLAELKLRETHREAKVANHMTYTRAGYLERQYAASELEVKNARKVFDKTIDNYISGKTAFINIDHVLDELRDSSVKYENIKYEHLLEKLTLAKLMGKDDFPGEKFDNLVEK